MGVTFNQRNDIRIASFQFNDNVWKNIRRESEIIGGIFKGIVTHIRLEDWQIGVEVFALQHPFF